MMMIIIIIIIIRNKSGDVRTSNLAVLAIRSRRTKAMYVDVVIDRFPITPGI